MEPDTFSLDVAEKTLHEQGFLQWEAPAVGNDILELERKGFPYWTEEGLEFCNKHVLHEARVRPILESMFASRCYLVHWMRYTAKPDRIICFRGGGPKARGPRFIVHLLPRGSRVAYYGGSHLVELPVKETEYRFYETLQSDLDHAGLTSTDCKFDDGGLVIFDARLRHKIQQKYAITFVFATENVLARWPPWELPNLPALQRKVFEEMESLSIGVNFIFGEPTPSEIPVAATEDQARDPKQGEFNNSKLHRRDKS